MKRAALRKEKRVVIPNQWRVKALRYYDKGEPVRVLVIMMPRRPDTVTAQELYQEGNYERIIFVPLYDTDGKPKRRLQGDMRFKYTSAKGFCAKSKGNLPITRDDVLDIVIPDLANEEQVINARHMIIDWLRISGQLPSVVCIYKYCKTS